VARDLEAVVFDWGGTLSVWAEVDLEDVWRAAARHLRPADPQALIRKLMEVEERFWAGVEESQTSDHLGGLLERATRELKMDVTGAVIEEAATHHLDAWTRHIAHDPDAAGVLAELRGRKLRIGLLSNTLWPRRFHERFLERDGLVDLIDERLYTSDMPRTKPHPSVFRAALDALQVTDPSKAVFVGDRPFDDIKGAKGVGMRAVLKPNPAVPEHDVEPDAVIDDLPSLIGVIDSWNRHLPEGDHSGR
jgi:putative hydrolase of the HAD superfamily